MPVASVQIVQITNTSTIPVPEGQDVNLEHKNNAGVGCLTKVEGTDAVPTIRINTTTNVKVPCSSPQLHCLASEKHIDNTDDIICLKIFCWVKYHIEHSQFNSLGQSFFNVI